MCGHGRFYPFMHCLLYMYTCTVLYLTVAMQVLLELIRRMVLYTVDLYSFTNTEHI